MWFCKNKGISTGRKAGSQCMLQTFWLCILWGRKCILYSGKGQLYCPYGYKLQGNSAGCSASARGNSYNMRGEECVGNTWFYRSSCRSKRCRKYPGRCCCICNSRRRFCQENSALWQRHKRWNFTRSRSFICGRCGTYEYWRIWSEEERIGIHYWCS